MQWRWQKQDVIVGDSTKSGRVTVWEEEIGKLELGKSYKMEGMMVRSFGRGNNKEMYLSTGKKGSQIEMMEDIGDIEEEEEEEEEVKRKVWKVWHAAAP